MRGRSAAAYSFELRSVATDVAAAVAAKLGGFTPPQDQVAAAIDQAMAGRVER